MLAVSAANIALEDGVFEYRPAGLSVEPLLNLNGQELANTEGRGHKATVEF